MSQRYNKLTVVLSGAGGFLGRHALKALLDDGMRVIAISSKSLSQLERLCHADFCSSDLTVIDQAEPELLRQNMAGADVFLNCAFPRNTDGRQLAEGLAFISKLFMLAAEGKVGSVINISSQSVYGQTRSEPATEETPVCLESPYATAKYATELMLDPICRDIPHTNIRLASLIGPGFDQRVVNKMVKRALTLDTIEVAENGSRFGYLDVDDAAHALIVLIRSDPTAWENIYNIGSPSGHSLTEIAEAICRSVRHETGRDCTIRPVDPISEPMMSMCSSEVFCSQFGWRAVCDLDGTIRSIIRCEREQSASAIHPA